MTYCQAWYCHEIARCYCAKCKMEVCEKHMRNHRTKRGSRGVVTSHWRELTRPQG